jgi:hypothetical protein
MTAALRRMADYGKAANGSNTIIVNVDAAARRIAGNRYAVRRRPQHKQMQIAIEEKRLIMGITVFNDVLLPNSIVSAGVSGKQLRLNTRVQTDNGAEAINVDLGANAAAIYAWHGAAACRSMASAGNAA